MRILTTAILFVAAAGCELLPFFENAPACTGNEQRVRDNACGLCGRGQLTERCTTDRTWAAYECDDPDDQDGDGYAATACSPGRPVDCNDDDETAFPGATGAEVCIVGEVQPCTTSCSTDSVRRCTDACTWGTCEECVPGTTSACTTECGSEGTAVCPSTCVPPSGAACTPPTEICNGDDDDCDATTDETFQCVAGETNQPCLTSCGSTGRGTCSDACMHPPAAECTVPPEECNGRDDDCDTTCDEGIGECCAGTTEPCTMPDSGPGYRECSVSCGWTDCIETTEICNGLDDNGNGRTDEIFQCVQNATGVTCNTTCGSEGSGTCNSDCSLPSPDDCAKPAESCNGVNDDCDSETDEGNPGGGGSCYTGPAGTSGKGICHGGDYQCIAGSLQCTGQVVPATETCNNQDDDCDTSKDEDILTGSLRSECAMGATQGCATPCGHGDGTRTCSAENCRWADCVPPPETCDGRDNDCNGAADDGLAPTFNACDGCVRRVYNEDWVFQFCNGPLSWHAARDWCAARGYHLTTFGDVAANDWVSDRAGELGMGAPWFGLYQDPAPCTSGVGEPRGCWRWVDGIAWSTSLWFTGQPDNSGGIEHCAQLYWDVRRWNDAGCGGLGPFVCEAFAEGSTP